MTGNINPHPIKQGIYRLTGWGDLTETTYTHNAIAFKIRGQNGIKYLSFVSPDFVFLVSI